MSDLNFLVSSAGRRGELVQILREVIARSGGRGRVHALDMSPLTSAGWLSDSLDLVPSALDETFIDEVLDLCQRHRILHVIPTIDIELPAYAAARQSFSRRGVNVWVSAPETIDIVRDKRVTNSWLRKHGFPTVQQHELLKTLRISDLSFPLIAKPACGSSSIGLRLIKCATDIEALDSDVEYVIETIAQGDEYTVDVLVDSAGVCQVAVPRRRIETRAGEVSKGVTVRNGAVIELAEAVAQELPGAYGVLNVQIFMDPRSERLNVIEINARFGGGFPLSWAAGAEIPLWLVQEYAQTSAPQACLDWTADKLMLRYDAALYLDWNRAWESGPRRC